MIAENLSLQVTGENLWLQTGESLALSGTTMSTNIVEAWKGAVEPAETGATGNEVQLWKGAVEPAAATSSSADALIGGVTRSVTRTLTRGVTEGWSWGA